MKPTSRATYSSAWIGIDGFKNSNLIQTGTGHEFVNGTARYYAWWEILPSAETVIPFSITLRNLSQQWTFRTLQRYIGPQTSVEWVMEAPQVDGSIAKLAHVSPTMFTCCRVNGKNPKLTPAMGGTMIQNNATVAIPSCPSRSGNSFVVKPLYTQEALLTTQRRIHRHKS